MVSAIIILFDKDETETQRGLAEKMVEMNQDWETWQFWQIRGDNFQYSVKTILK